MRSAYIMEYPTRVFDRGEPNYRCDRTRQWHGSPVNFVHFVGLKRTQPRTLPRLPRLRRIREFAVCLLKIATFFPLDRDAPFCPRSSSRSAEKRKTREIDKDTRTHPSITVLCARKDFGRDKDR